MDAPSHPLVGNLLARLPADARILEIGTGSGRNARAIALAGYDCTSVEQDATRAQRARAALAELSNVHVLVRAYDSMDDLGTFDGCIATHAFLHGTRESIASLSHAARERLRSDGVFCAVFGSVRDARYGRGQRLAEATFAETDGDEPGVAHTYFTRDGLTTLLDRVFRIELLEERNADATVGAWAHAGSTGRVQWFLTARSR